MSRPRGRARARTAIAVGVGVLLLSGCGGGQENDTLSATDYRKEANGLCRAAVQDAEKIGSPTGTSADSVARYFERSRKMALRRQDEFEALGPPAELRSDHDESARQGRQAIALLERLARELRAGASVDERFAVFAADFNKLVRSGNVLSERLGTPDCLAEEIPTG